MQVWDDLRGLLYSEHEVGRVSVQPVQTKLGLPTSTWGTEYGPSQSECGCRAGRGWLRNEPRRVSKRAWCATRRWEKLGNSVREVVNQCAP